MTTATKKQPSTELARLQADRDQAYAGVQVLNREASAFEVETSNLKTRMSTRMTDYPEEFSGADFQIKPGTDSAKLREEIRQRQEGGYPGRADLDAAIADFHKQDERLHTFLLEHVGDLFGEIVHERFEPAEERFLAAIGEAAAAASDMRAANDEAFGIVVRVPRINGQALTIDQRVTDWVQLPDAVGEIVRPALTELGEWKVQNHG